MEIYKNKRLNLAFEFKPKMSLYLLCNVILKYVETLVLKEHLNVKAIYFLFYIKKTVLKSTLNLNQTRPKVNKISDVIFY